MASWTVEDGPANDHLDDLASRLAGGVIKIKTGGGSLLATLNFGSPSHASASGRTASSNSISPVSASGTGTAAIVELYESGGSTLVLSGSVGTSGANLNLDSTSITSGQTVTINSLDLNYP